ncbi:hypothetical protein D869_gp143 [Caulobacter phage CcrRogue]|uniref:Uncharacterized protein n=1 Tax=Caulobacter phage CcrRogue TaxID=2927986 RepID=K4JP32_9CAUD|nr:hypothetical protein D869_gp143 [Caulobacter phage CcrRogue]AFU86771.1 hypothetical protein CcrRogue_gp289 [Caulobacter phage CcrRogue]
MSYTEAHMEALVAFHQNEMDVGDGAWGRYVKTLEQRTGIEDLDGDNSEEARAYFCDMGYSLDDTFDMFQKGVSLADAETAILRSCYEAATRAALAGVKGLTEAQERAQAAGKTDYVAQLQKQIDSLIDGESAEASAVERAAGC